MHVDRKGDSHVRTVARGNTACAHVVQGTRTWEVDADVHVDADVDRAWNGSAELVAWHA